MDLDTVTLGRFSGLDGFGRSFLDLDFADWERFSSDLDLSVLKPDWIWTVSVGFGFFSFQSGLDLKRYFQKTLYKKKKKLTDTGFLIVWSF